MFGYGEDYLANEVMLTVTKLWSVESHGEERKVTYLSTLVKHTQAVNVVRWCPRGSCCPLTVVFELVANKLQVNCSQVPATMATSCSGSLLRTRRHTPISKKDWKTKRPGGSRPCAVPSARKFMILHGHQMACSSLRGAWITLLVSTMHKLVRYTGCMVLRGSANVFQAAS